MRLSTLAHLYGTHGGRRDRITCDVEMEKLGTQAPYFSVTARVYRSGHMIGGGAMHEDILKLWPHLADVVALHLSDDTGAPMHAAANALYWAAGAIPGHLGQQYHGGNAHPSKGREECLAVLAEHLRVTTDEASDIARRVGASADPSAEMQRVCDEMRPRWRREAEAAIEKYGLAVQAVRP